MTGLLRSELLRMRSRRIVWVLAVAAALGIVIGVTIGAVNSERPSEAEMLRAQQRYERAFQRCLDGQFFAPEEVPPEFGTIERFCEVAVDEIAAGGSTDAMELRDLRSLLESFSTMVILLGVVLGATLVGADWASGTYGTLLTWEPRRLRALVARVIVVAITVFVVTASLQALFVASFRLAVQFRGSTALAPADWLGEVVGVSFRVSIAAVALAVIAAALATIGRSTVLAVGALFGYLVIVEGFLAGVVDGLDRWLLVRALTVVVVNEAGSPLEGAFGGISVDRGRALVLAYVVIGVAIAAIVMRRRDVQ